MVPTLQLRTLRLQGWRSSSRMPHPPRCHIRGEAGASALASDFLSCSQGEGGGKDPTPGPTLKISLQTGAWTAKWSRSVVSNSATSWTVAYQAPPFMRFSWQEYWSGLPFPSLGELPNPGIKPGPPALLADTLPSEPPGKALDKKRGRNKETKRRKQCGKEVLVQGAVNLKLTPDLRTCC